MQKKPICFPVRFGVANVVAVMMVDAVSIVVVQNTYITLATESVIPNYKCNNNSIQRDWIESYMINIIDNYIHHLSKAQKQNIYQLCFDSVQSSKKADISILNQRLNSLNKELSRIVDVITITNSPTLIEKLTDLEQQKAEIQLRIKALSQEKGKILSKQKINLLLTKIKKMLKEKSVPQLKELMDLIVNEIIVNEEDVIVYLNIPITK